MIQEQLFDFDTIIDRISTSSVKWGVYHDRDIIPLWVADMDFKSPPAVLKALHHRIDQDVFGYTMASRELTETLISFLSQTYHWQVPSNSIVWLPGLVTGLNLCCRAVGNSGDEVLTTTPIYPPFLSAPKLSDRKLVTVSLINNNGHWELDFVALEKAITAKTKLLLFCNPYNPVGRVFTKAELLAVANLAIKHDLIICSDEIHAGLILDSDKAHIPMASLGSEISERTITLMAASKTYNIPGLGCSFAIISNEKLRKKFQEQMDGIVPFVNALGFVATNAAYKDGESWRRALIQYLRINRDIVMQRLAKIPQIKATHVEGTYLAWLDARDLKLKNPAQFFESIGVGLTDGDEFGTPGFLRINFGCSRILLERALERIETGLKNI